MGLIQIHNGEREAELERMLKGIPFSGDMNFQLFTKIPGSENPEKALFPCYLLPLELGDERSSGLFCERDRVAKACVGFYRRILWVSEHYSFSCSKNLQKENMREDTLYLPLQLTSIRTDVTVQKDGKDIPAEGSPYFVYGIRGREGLHPLQSIWEYELGFSLVYLGKSKEGKFDWFKTLVKQGDEKFNRLSDFVTSMRTGKPIETLPPDVLSNR